VGASSIADEVFGLLVGRWRLERGIGPGVGTASGIAVFADGGPGRLNYREDVSLRLATGYTGDAYREYTYLLEADRIRVLLADGTTMHDLVFASTSAPAGSGAEPVRTATDDHDCRADRYRGTYRMLGDNVLTVEMDVSGPAKDYRMVTRYERV